MTDSDPPHVARPTFYKDVLPILQSNCQSCHRPGEVAPMSLLTYGDARSAAAAIKMAVLTKKMPPWYADPQYGHFSNERKLAPEQIKTLVTWVDGGAKPGNPKDAPAPLKFVNGWNIGVPDRILEMPTAFNVPAEGTVDLPFVVIPRSTFTKDTWVRAAEIRPGNRALLHHAIAFVRPPDSQWLRDAKPGEFYVMKKGSAAHHEVVVLSREKRSSDFGQLLAFYTPGLQPLELTSEAKLIKAGSDIVLQVHYAANGTAGTDKTKLGLIFAKDPPALTNVVLAASNGGLKIPPNNGNYEVKAQVQLEDTVTLSSLQPHMHFRGKDFLYQVIYPDGRTETILSVPKYDFNWQLEYRLAEPLLLPKGTRIECTAHFDNSANNPYNPDPNQEVRWGDQTWEEMMTGFFSVIVDPKVNAATLIKHEVPGLRTPPDQAKIKQSDTNPTGSAEGSARSNLP